MLHRHNQYQLTFHTTSVDTDTAVLTMNHVLSSITIQSPPAHYFFLFLVSISKLIFIHGNFMDKFIKLMLETLKMYYTVKLLMT